MDCEHFVAMVSMVSFVSVVSLVSVVKRQSATTSVWKMVCKNCPGLPFQRGMPYHADKCRQMEANDDKRGNQVGSGGFVRVAESV